MSGATTDPATGAVRLTRAELAALVESADAPDPRLVPVLATVRAARARGVVRRWRGERLPAAELVVGDAGVVVLAGGGRPDDVQQPRWHPRPAATARLVAELLELPPRRAAPPLPAAPMPWADLVEEASDAATGLALADLQWAAPATGELASVLVLAWRVDGGVAALDPVDGDPTVVRPRAVTTLDVWGGLTALASTR